MKGHTRERPRFGMLGAYGLALCILVEWWDKTRLTDANAHSPTCKEDELSGLTKTWWNYSGRVRRHMRDVSRTLSSPESQYYYSLNL